jgi:hypothetical protein
VSVVVEANGSVRPCFFHGSIGSVREAPIAAIVARNLRAFRESLDVGANPVCVRCVCSLKTSWRSAPWAHGSAGAERRSAPERRRRRHDRSNAENPLLCACARVRGRWPRTAPRRRARQLVSGGPGADAVTWRRTATGSPPSTGRRRWSEARRRFTTPASPIASTSARVGIGSNGSIRPAPVDAAYSNFGPLNCVVDLPAAARRIADRLTPHGLLVASVIGRVCPWEIALYAARGDVARATVRFRRGLVPVPLNGRTVWTRYFTPREFEAIFAAAGMTRVSLRALGLFVPPPYLHAFADRHPGLIARLQRAEDRWGGRPVLRGWGDHFLVVLRKA